MVLEHQREEVVGVEGDGGADDQAQNARRPAERREREGETEQRRRHYGGRQMVAATAKKTWKRREEADAGLENKCLPPPAVRLPLALIMVASSDIVRHLYWWAITFETC
ncbi:hypothetical protein GW17_00033981 [Ensete ventricosum]|nr:hypothetical protein GW17_00033981 [Ensete ventricosum]